MDLNQWVSNIKEAAKTQNDNSELFSEVNSVLANDKKDANGEGFKYPGNTELRKLGLAGLKKHQRDIKVTVLKNVSKELKPFVPEVDKTYHLDAKKAVPILLAWEMGDNALVTGPTGSGKSSLIEQLCARTNRPFIRINSSGDMDSSHFFGALVVEDGATVWKDGPVTEAVKYGGVLLWDEWDVSPPEITMAMQWLLEKNGKLVIKEKPGTNEDRTIIPHKDFRIVCSGNTKGSGDMTAAFAGTQVQNTASIDRFTTCITVDYMTPVQEAKVLGKKYKDVSKDFIKKLCQLAKLIRQAYESGNIGLTMSPRTVQSIVEKAMWYQGDVDMAFDVAYVQKLEPADIKCFEELRFKAFGDDESSKESPTEEAVEETANG